MTLTDVVDWGDTWEGDIVLEDVAEDGTISATSLSDFTVREAVIRLTAESEDILVTPTLTESAPGVLTIRMSPAQTRLLPRTGPGGPRVVGQVRLATADGADAMSPIYLKLEINAGARQ